MRYDDELLNVNYITNMDVEHKLVNRQETMEEMKKKANFFKENLITMLSQIRIWSFYLFYVMDELWGGVVISVLFWRFANQVNI